MIEIRRATHKDSVGISSLLITNSSERGGALYGDWSIGVVEKWITSDAMIAVAIDGSKLLGVLFTSEKAQASAAPVLAMLSAWSGAVDAYVYGPICVDEAARGQGVVERLFAYVAAELSGREAILFIKANNLRSLRAHSRLGMTQVAHFELCGEVFVVLSSEGTRY
jgi:L-amino acid N-acyltransferase YncA